MKYLWVLLIVFGIGVGCQTNKKLTSLKEKQLFVVSKDSVVIFAKNEELPKGLSKIGNIEQGEASFLGSGIQSLSKKYEPYYSVLYKLKEKAASIGGNVIEIKKHKVLDYPYHRNSESHCVKAVVYKSENPIKLKKKEKEKDVARLHVYRFYGSVFTKVDLFLNDSLITKVKSNFKKSILLDKEGEYLIKTKESDAITLRVEKGKEYYLRCKITGFWKVKPLLKIMDVEKGKLEFDAFSAKHN